jgi:hypothetical protein
MKAFHVAIALMLLTCSASAQSINLLVDKPALTQEEKEKQKAVEDAYRAKMNQIPDQKTSSDPWATVRSSDTPKNPQARKQTPK